MELSSSSKDKLVGGLLVGPKISDQSNTTLIISYSGSSVGDFFNVDRQVLASAVLNITLIDEKGVSITQLDAPLIICLALPNTTIKSDKFCLSYFDEDKAKWRCEDECLTNTPSNGNPASEESKFLCGETSHLTNFALLLTGGSDNAACQSKSDNNTLGWVSLGMVAGAIVLVALCGLVVEVNFRWKAHRQAALLS